MSAHGWGIDYQTAETSWDKYPPRREKDHLSRVSEVENINAYEWKPT
jgi:hypothetical protein